MQMIIAVACPLPSLEKVKVHYNLEASYEKVNGFVESMGRNHLDDVVSEVENWPKEDFPGGALDTKAPMAWRVWLVRQGLQTAIGEFIDSPNSGMG
jgi:hypothetical protein